MQEQVKTQKRLTNEYGHDDSSNDLQAACTVGAQFEGKEDDRKESCCQTAEYISCIGSGD